MIEIGVIAGDITQQDVDAIATLINGHGAWSSGGMDKAILRAGGSHFHDQARVILAQRGTRLDDKEIIIATGKGETAFSNVIFCVDRLQQPLSILTVAILEAALKQEYTTIALPAMRCGVMAGEYEADTQAAVVQIAMGIRAFMEYREHINMSITFVVYGDLDTQQLLDSEIKKLQTPRSEE